MSVKFSDLKDEAARNLLRGMLDRSTPSDVRRTYDHLRALALDGNTAAIYQQILYNPLLAHLPLPQAFPKSPVSGWTNYRPAVTSLQKELIYQLVRFDHHRDLVIDFISDISKLNECIFEYRSPDIVSILKEIIEKYGYSNIILKKIGVVRYIFRKDENVVQYCDEIANLFNAKQKDALCILAFDACDDDFPYFSIFSSFQSMIDAGRLGDTTAHIVNSHFFPTEQLGSENEISEVLLSFGLLSLVDAIIYICILRYNTDAARRLGIDTTIDKYFNDDLRQTWETYFKAFCPSEFLANPDYSEIMSANQDAFMEEVFYRQTYAFLEYSSICSYRSKVDWLFRRRYQNVSPKSMIGQYTLNDLCDTPLHYTIKTDGFDPQSSGSLHRTVALFELIARGETTECLTDEQTIVLLNQTKGVARFGSTEELKSVFRSSEPSRLRSYLQRALIYDSSSSNLDSHALRKVVQDLVIAEFDRDLVKFADYLADRGAHVARHFYDLCSEMFLVQLFELFESSTDVAETKARLLEWYGTRFDDQGSVERARGLRLDLKLQQVRGDIDDTRLYVDPLRFVQWVQDNFQDELQKIGRTETDGAPELEILFKSDDPLEVMRRPYLRLARVLQSCFTEFCTNKFFGVDSYIGRRIRHGTLKGFMLADLKALMSEDSYTRLYEHPNLSRYLHSWLNKNETRIEEMGSEWLQIKTSKKQKGVIDTNILAANKIYATLAAVIDVMKQLRSQFVPTHSSSIIYEYCWVLLEKDMSELRKEIARTRTEIGVLDKDHMISIGSDHLSGLSADLCRSVNQLLDSKFRSLSNWFTKPSNLSPSAPLNLLIDAVITEVETYFPDYKPSIERLGETDLTLFGYNYQHIYDFLYVVVYNAAEHGNRLGPLIIDTQILFGVDGLDLLSVRVTSEACIEDDMEIVSKRVLDAMTKNTDDAMVVEKNSGLSKIKKMEFEVDEIISFTANIQERRVSFALAMRFGVA